MLVHANAHAAEGAVAKKAHIPLHICAGHIHHRWQYLGVPQRARGVKHSLRQCHLLGLHARFVGLQHFTRHAVELDAVAVVRNMAARDHERRDLQRKRMQRQSRRRDVAAEKRHAALGLYGRCTRRQNARCTGPQVTRQGDLHARGKLAHAGHMLQKSCRVGKAHGIRHGRHGAARTTGAERDTALGHKIADIDKRKLRHRHHGWCEGIH